ncbi:hypothetical protein EV178_005672 [Coemansia sp. RSA 1646]|nr:hypothetical protein EV178_005672 [Coemansia sp. RSA 1646]KAJ1767090.1 hypothetical protein LPJ74_005554 [Coemansia sp. RSA 1843]
MSHVMASGGEAGAVVRGYLPTDYYAAHRVFKQKPPQLTPSNYPNKIDVDSSRSYAILVRRGSNACLLLQNIYAWMSVHFYVAINALDTQPHTTGNIVVEAYESPERAYAMVVFRASTVADEQTDHIMRSHGHSTRRGPCPPPITALLCQTGVTLQSIWQWLNLHRGRLAYMVGAPPLQNTVAIAVASRRSDRSRESLDSTLLPAYEPPLEQSALPIPEDNDDPPAYSDNTPARLLATQSLPELLQSYGQTTGQLEEDSTTPSTSSSSGVTNHERISWGLVANEARRHYCARLLSSNT